MEVRRVGIWLNTYKPTAVETADQITRALSKRGVEVCRMKYDGRQMSPEALLASHRGCDVLAAVGGDGTFLTGMSLALDLGVPMLGVNAGHMGFLTEVDASVGEVERAVDKLLSGDYFVEERMLLDVSVGGRPVGSVLNEVAITRAGGSMRIFGVEFFVDGQRAESFSGDGLILATPTGSTAYSFSAGGPVVVPGAQVIVVTPVCPHTPNNRPVILPATATVDARVTGPGAAVLMLDGAYKADLEPGSSISVRQSERRLGFVRLEKRNFFDQLKAKLTRWDS